VTHWSQCVGSYELSEFFYMTEQIDKAWQRNTSRFLFSDIESETFWAWFWMRVSLTYFLKWRWAWVDAWVASKVHLREWLEMEEPDWALVDLTRKLISNRIFLLFSTKKHEKINLSLWTSWSWNCFRNLWKNWYSSIEQQCWLVSRLMPCFWSVSVVTTFFEVS